MNATIHTLPVSWTPAPPRPAPPAPRAAEPPRHTAVHGGLAALFRGGECVFAVAALLLFSDALLPLLVEGSGGSIRLREGNPLLRASFAAVHGTALLLVLVHARGVVRAALAHPFAPVLVALALASVAWSDDPDLTLRRGAALAATTAFGLYLAARFSLRSLLRLLGWALGVAAVLSLAFALLLPGLGVGQGDHAGQWRGIYPHKNTLGQVMVLAALVFFLLWRDAERRRWIPAAGLALCGALLLLSRSASAIAVLAVCAALLPLYAALRRPHGRGVPLGIAVVLAGGAAAALAVANLDVVLALLGRESTLTGRTLLWASAVEAVGARPWSGAGYSAFWTGWGGGSGAVWDAAGWTTPHAHNGFLDLALELGMGGVAIFLAGAAVAARRGVAALRGTPGAAALWPLLLLAFFLVYNLTESSLLRQNSLFWVLYVATASSALLRPAAEGAPARPGRRLSPGVGRLQRKGAGARTAPGGGRRHG